MNDFDTSETKILRNARVGTICAAPFDETYCRVKVLSAPNSTVKLFSLFLLFFEGGVNIMDQCGEEKKRMNFQDRFFTIISHKTAIFSLY